MITYNGTNDCYRELIERFVAIEFPHIGACKVEDLVEAISEAFIGSKQTRQGPRPNLESVVKIRDVVRRSIEQKRSIPVLIASASVKLPLGRGIDLAELGVLRQLSCLNDKVKEYFEPGLHFRFRMEDVTELILSEGVANVSQITREYRESFQALIDVLDMGDFIELVPESSLISDVDAYMDNVHSLIPVFEKHMRETNGMNPAPLSPELAKLGWKGTLSFEQREYFKARYRRLYPNINESEHVSMMARYFSNTLSRVHFKASGADPSFDGRLEISFVPPQPDSPIISSRVFMRTVPTSHTSMHLPYWDAKGFLKICDRDNSTRIGLLPWWDTSRNFAQGSIIIENNGKKVMIKADTLVED